MANVIENQWNASRKRLNELQEDVRDAGARWRSALNRRQSIAVGKLRDSSLSYLYGVGHGALDTAATVARKLPLLDRASEQFRSRSGELEDARKALGEPPIEDYDELNVQKVSDALEGLGPWELQKVREYEEQHKNRVTVLRAVDRKLS